MKESGIEFRRLQDVTAAHNASPLAEQTTRVEYRSAGHCLLIGDDDAVFDWLERLDLPRVSLVIVDPAQAGVEHQRLTSGESVFRLPALALQGHLGAFVGGAPEVTPDPLSEAGAFDLVLDTGARACIGSTLPPFGYLHIPPGSGDREAELAEFQALVGEFEKPRYFRYQSSLCAQSRSGLTGCQRCLAVCATDAIRRDGDGIAVDPYLCQGCGSCATVCPSGAISYAWPPASDAIQRSRQLLADHGASMLLLHAEADQTHIDALFLPSHLLPMAVEEVTAYGADYWFSLLASGTRRILVLAPEASDPGHDALVAALELTQALLGALGLDTETVQLCQPETLASRVADVDRSDREEGVPLPSPKAFTPQQNKRQNLRLALDGISAQRPPAESVTPLADNAAFGRILVDRDACTLCMACVSTCPAGALLDGQSVPALRMIEANCLQCGLCERACPESAIGLEPRYNWNSVDAREAKTLHEDAPFHCVVCHTPFATAAIITRMMSGLSDHWMYGDERARRRLKMCADCRVKDIFRDGEAGIDVHGKQS